MAEKLKHTRILSKLFNEPWLIQPDYLGKMIEIAKGFGDIESVQTKLSQQLPETEKTLVRDGVAHIPIQGPIFPRANMFTQISGATSVSSLAKDFQVALDDDEVSSIVLDIDSPGGAVTGINEMANIIRAGGEKKDVVAYVNGTGASAAYWLASAANEVVLDATARVGSIGVVVAYPSEKDADSVEFWNTSSPNKRVDVSTEVGKKVVVDELDALADVFINAVATHRGTVPGDVIANYGKGGVLVGKSAVDVGMADRLGSFEGLLAEKSNSNNDGGFIMADEKVEVTVDSLKASDPSVFEAVKDLGKTEAESSMKKMVASKNSEISDKDSEISGLKEQLASFDDRLKAFEKTEVLRTEREMKATAGGIVSTTLSASSVPVRLHEKIRATLDHGKFVAEGKLDHKAFSEHVTAEVKDWEDNLTDDTVQGFGATFQTPTGETDSNADEIVNRMAASAGQTVQ